MNSVVRYLVLCLFAFFTCSTLAVAQECAHEGGAVGASKLASTGASVPTSGEYKALVVYVRFEDDTSTSRDWATTLTSPPNFSSDLIGTSATESAFPDESVSRYLYDQSDPTDEFILYGYTYPNVIVTDDDEYDYYNRDASGNSQTSGFGVLTVEVLDKVDPNVDFSQFDKNNDGEIDYLFIVLRGTPDGYAHTGLGAPVRYSGVSDLEDDSGTISDTVWPSDERPSKTYDGKSLNWRNGSYIINARSGNIIPRLYHSALWAHEIGHDLWEDHFIHLPPIYGNDVPSNNTRRVGYALMPGAGGADDMAGNETIAAYERDLIGWASCSDLTSDQTVTLGDLYTSGDCSTIDLTGDATGRTVYVSNAQRISYWDELHTFAEGSFYAEDGLMTTGMVVGITDGTGYDELPGDNELDIGILASVYLGDLRTPTTATQVTPWTKPNINGYTEYPANYSPSWDAIDNIRAGSGTDLVYDYIADFRADPVVREDSWIGAESSGTTLTGDLVVNAGATLTIEAGTTLKFAQGKKLYVYGTLEIEGTSSNPVTLTNASGATWGGVYFASNSAGDLDYVTIDGVQGWGVQALYMTNADVYIENSVIKDCAGICDGIQATSGSYLWLNRTTVHNNAGNGVQLSNSIAYLVENAITNNSGYGVEASYYASPLFAYASTGYFHGNNTIEGNADGVKANSNTTVTVGTGSSGLGYENRVFDNTTWNVVTNGSGSIMAKYIWWGNANCVTSKMSGSVTYSPCRSTDPGPAFKSGMEASADADRLSAAIEARYLGETAEALSLLRSILTRPTDIADADRALLELGQLYSQSGDVGVLGYLASQTQGGGHAPAFAKEVLMMASFRIGDEAAGKTLAAELIKEEAGTTHERHALLALFWADANAGRKDQAGSRLAELLAAFPGNADVADAASLAEREAIHAIRTDDVATKGEAATTSLAAEAYPNPFNPVAVISVDLALRAHTSVKVFDVLGRQVAVLADHELGAGRHQLRFDAGSLPTGIYLYTVVSGPHQVSGTMSLVR